MRPARIAVRTEPGRYRLLEAEEIFYVEAEGGDTLIRTRRRRRLASTATLGELEDSLAEAGFLRTHRSYLVNTARVLEVRLRSEESSDWELKLDPPVNRILPIGREQWPSVRDALGL